MDLLLLGALAASIIVTSYASGMVRDAAEDLSAETQVSVSRRERSRARIWNALEWLGIGLILIGIFALFRRSSRNVFSIAGGLLVFCSANAASSWASCFFYKREAPDSKAARTALHAALLVTLAEIVLIVVVAWRVYNRIDWDKWLGTTSKGDPAEVTKEDNGTWLDESIALKELGKFDGGYIDGLVEAGSLRTKTVGGKKMYNARDVGALKNKKQDVLPE